MREEMKDESACGDSQLVRVVLALRSGLTQIVEELSRILEEVAPPEARIPQIDLEALPWLKRDKTPAKPGEWGWIFGPKSVVGPVEGSQPLIDLLEKHGGKVELPPYEISFTKEKAFIQRRPLKQSSTSSEPNALQRIH